MDKRPIKRLQMVLALMNELVPSAYLKDYELGDDGFEHYVFYHSEEMSSEVRQTCNRILTQMRLVTAHDTFKTVLVHKQ